MNIKIAALFNFNKKDLDVINSDCPKNDSEILIRSKDIRRQSGFLDEKFKQVVKIDNIIKKSKELLKTASGYRCQFSPPAGP